MLKESGLWYLQKVVFCLFVCVVVVSVCTFQFGLGILHSFFFLCLCESLLVILMII